MSGFVRHVRIETTFDESGVVVVLKQLRLEDAMKLRGLRGEEAILLYSQMLPSYIVSMTDMKDANGEVIPLDEIIGATYFAKLLSEILQKHVDAAKITNPP